MKNRYSMLIISSFEYNLSVVVKILKEPNYDEIHTYFSNYLDL